MQYTWKIGGEAGFGIMTTGLVFSKIVNRLGYYIFDYILYPSLIRGGHNTYEVIFSDEKVESFKRTIDCLVCLNKETFTQHQERLAQDAIVIYDQDEFEIKEGLNKISIPFNKIVSQLKGKTVMKNTVALGATIKLLGGDITELFKIIEEQFNGKGTEVIEFNKKFVRMGVDQVKNNYSDKIKNVLERRNTVEKLVLSGNDAFSLGAVVSDCRLYAAYPMTPSSSVLATLAGWQEKTGMVVRHAEDEIAVINTALGAAFAGVRSAVGTSGGGFALMAESISLAGITETPLVIFLAQRPAPATGMPTWTEQEDLLFAVSAGHGEFPRIILAPADIEEMFQLTTQAFNLADIYQTPVIILSDMLLSESHQSVEKKAVDDLIGNYQIEKGKIVFKSLQSTSQLSKRKIKPQLFPRYKLTADGISPRLLPGTPGFYYQANSYEHLEDGHTTEEADARKNQVEKRNKKRITYLANHFQPPAVYGDFEAAVVVFVSWGSNKGAIIEAQKLLKEKSIRTALVHFSYLYPLDGEKISRWFNQNKKYVLVENNSFGQFGKLLKQEAGIEIKKKILKYDGRPIRSEEIVSYIDKLRQSD